MLEKTTPGWAIECTDECGLSRIGHYACALVGFVAAVLFVLVATTTLLVVLGVSELIASFTIVFGFFALWAGAWITAAAVWNAWIARRAID